MLTGCIQPVARMVTFIYMRRLIYLLFFLAALTSHVSAQFTSDGFYRVQNFGTKRYLYLTDCTGYYDMNRDIGDFGALQMFTGKDKTVSDAASIIYIKKYGSQVDIQGQGIGIYKIVSRYVDLNYISSGAFKGTYTVSATEQGITKYLDDEETNKDFEKGIVGTNRNSPYRNWLIYPVNSSTDDYFGIKPLFSLNGKYYYPFYAAFPFKAASSGMKFYSISKTDSELGYAVLTEITGVVPSKTPVLVECSSDAPASNRLDLIESSASPISPNSLSGTFFCNYERRNKSEYSLIAFNPARMRVIGVTGQGKLGFVTSTRYLNQINGDYYIPANTSYLNVPEGSPADFTIVTEEEYNQILANHQYTVTFMIDGTVYRTEKLKAGQQISADTPVREGYTFSGWSGLPATMPARDITVTGTFTINNYNITYKLDGSVYQVVSVPYGSTVTPLKVEREGYVFSGWDGLPATMPAHDVTVNGSFSIASFKLTYMVDGAVYQTQTVTFGATVAPLDNPIREGCTFSGWSGLPATMPAHDVTVTGSFTSIVYTIRYMLDGQLFLQQEVSFGQTITPPVPPQKTGYAFSRWEELPKTMPAANLTVTAVYEPIKYTLTYLVDGEVYRTVQVPYGAPLVLIEDPVREGHIFSGWSQIPATMPAEDISVSGTFAKGTYKLEYILNGAGFKDYVFFSTEYQYGQTVVPYSRSPRSITGYTFTGWGEAPAKMPGHDVRVYGTYKGNDYVVTYMIDGKEYRKVTVACGDTIPELPFRQEGYTFSGWSGLPVTMPAQNITVTGKVSVNFYILKYVLEVGEKGGTQLFRTTRYSYGAEVHALASAPSRLGYTFTGWEQIPATMPASNVTVRGRYQANIYKVRYYVGDRMVYQQDVACDDSIPAYTYETAGFVITDADWQGTRYSTMPARDVTYNVSQELIDDLNAIHSDEEERRMAFDLSGRRVSAVKPNGLYIVNGKKILKR